MSGGVTTGGAGITTGRSGIFTGRAGVNIIGADSVPWVQPSTVRLMFTGASIIHGWVVSGSGLAAALNAAYPGTTFTVENWTQPGAGRDIDVMLTDFQTDLATVDPSDPYEQNYFFFQTGAINSLVPYSTATPAELAKFDLLTDFRDDIVAAGFPESAFYLFELSFRLYGPHSSYFDEAAGSVPFTEAFYTPLVQTPMSHADGTPFFDWYTVLYNGYPDSMSDTVHPSASGYAELQQHFVDTIGRYLVTGNRPTQIRQDLFTDAAAVPSGLAGTAGDGEVALTWTHQKVTRQYKIYRDGVLVHTTGNNLPTDDYTDTGLTNGVEYDYTISAVNDAGETAQSAVVSVTPESGSQGIVFVMHASGSASDLELNRRGTHQPASATFSQIYDTSGVAVTGVTGRIVNYGTSTVQEGKGNLGATTGGTTDFDLTNTQVLQNFMFTDAGPVTAEVRGLPANTTVDVEFVASRTGLASARNLDIDANGVRVLDDYDVNRDPAVIESFQATTNGSGDLDIEAFKGGGGNDTFAYIGGIKVSY